MFEIWCWGTKTFPVRSRLLLSVGGLMMLLCLSFGVGCWLAWGWAFDGCRWDPDEGGGFTDMGWVRGQRGRGGGSVSEVWGSGVRRLNGVWGRLNGVRGRLGFAREWDGFLGWGRFRGERTLWGRGADWRARQGHLGSFVKDGLSWLCDS